MPFSPTHPNIVISTGDAHAFVSIGAEKPASPPTPRPSPCPAIFVVVFRWERWASALRQTLELYRGASAPGLLSVAATRLFQHPLQPWVSPRHSRQEALASEYAFLSLPPRRTPPAKNPAKTRVKPPNHLTPCKQTTSTWRSSSTQSAILNTESKKAPAKAGAFPINAPKSFRKTILPVTPLVARF